MKKNSLPLFIGVICSLVAIWLVNDYLLVGQCTENGGSFDYSKAMCLLENGEEKVLELEKYFVVMYFFMGLLISLFVSLLVRKVFNIEQ